MAQALAPQYTQRPYFWTAWKAIALVKGGNFQHDDDGNVYTIWFYDGPEVHVCTIWKLTVPDGVVTGAGYTQVQNDADLAEWEASYKSASNKAIDPRTSDGRITVCTTVTKKTKCFKLRTACFYTSKAGSLISINPLTDLAYGDMTMVLSKWDPTANSGAGGWVSATDVDAERTVINWDPTYAFEILGGFADMPPSLFGGTTDAWHIACVGLPDYVSYGLAVDFVSRTNIEAISASRIVSDGAATQYLSPTIVAGVNYHTNRLRWIVEHPAGAQQRFQIYLRTFV